MARRRPPPPARGRGTHAPAAPSCTRRPGCRPLPPDRASRSCRAGRCGRAERRPPLAGEPLRPPPPAPSRRAAHVGVERVHAFGQHVARTRAVPHQEDAGFGRDVGPHTDERLDHRQPFDLVVVVPSLALVRAQVQPPHHFGERRPQIRRRRRGGFVERGRHPVRREIEIWFPPCKNAMSSRPTVSPRYLTCKQPSLVKLPITVASTSRRAASASSGPTCSGATASVMRSCASLSKIPHGARPAYLSGARSSSSNAPPGFSAISPTLDDSPPAPLSVMARYSP